MKNTIINLPAILIFCISQIALVGMVDAGGKSIDDISIQVIGLDEIPEEALERIPLPVPDFGGMTDIREELILNRPVAPPAPAVDSIAIPGPPNPGGDNTASPPDVGAK